jgi:hypothetical protein
MKTISLCIGIVYTRISWHIVIDITVYIATVYLLLVFFMRIFSQYWSSCARNMCHILLAGYDGCATFSLFLTSGICREYVRMKTEVLYIIQISQVKTVYMGKLDAHAIYCDCAIFSSAWILTWEGIFWLERVQTIIKLLWIYVRFLIIACCLLYHVIQTKSVTRRTQLYS